MLSLGTPSDTDQFDEAIHLIEQVDLSIKEMRFTDACKQLDGLANFPEFIEHHLDSWIPAVYSQMTHQMGSTCQLLYTFCKILGHGSIIDVYMPCTLDISNSVIKSYCDFNQDTPWQCRYIYLLWCSCLIRLPFPLSRISLCIQQLVSLSLQQLDTFSPEMHAAAIFLANYFNRPDVNLVHQFNASIGHLQFLLALVKLNSDKQKLDEGIMKVIADAKNGTSSPIIKKLLMKIYKRLPGFQNEATLKFCMQQLSDKVFKYMT